MNDLQKDESPVAAGRFATVNSGIERAPIVADPADVEKQRATLIARLALAGHSVHETSDGFLVTRWNFAKHCPNLRSLAGFAQQLGVRS